MPRDESGKAMLEAAEKAYDEVAAKHGIDEFGDEVDFEDDDDEALEATEAEDHSEEVEEEGHDEIEASEASDEPVEAPVAEVLPDAPVTWRQEWKDAFNSITDPKMRNVFVDMNKQMNAAFTKSMMEAARVRKDNQRVAEVVTPHIERLQRAGISPDVAIARALGWDAHMQKDPVQGWLDYGKAMGIDTDQVMQQASQEQMYLTPQERAIQQSAQQQQQELQRMRQEWNQYQQTQQQAEWRNRQANAYQMLDQFMNAKDSSGRPLHPYIEHVAPQMTDFIQKNAAPDLESAYQMALAVRPDVRAALQQSRQAGQVKAAKGKAERVRKASSSGIVGKGSGKPAKAPRSIEQIASAAYDKIANG
jgi:hypothetical protein